MDAAAALGRLDRAGSYSAAALATEFMLSVRGLLSAQAQAAQVTVPYPASSAVNLVTLTTPIILRFALLVLGLRKLGARRHMFTFESEIGDIVEALPGPFNGGIFDWTSACMIFASARGVGFSSMLSNAVGVAFGIVNVM